MVWAVNTWKDFGDGRWDSNYDLVYRIIDTTNAAFLTEERRATDDFSSDYMGTVIADQSVGFNVVWGNNLSDINLLSVASSSYGFQAFQDVSCNHRQEYSATQSASLNFQLS